MALSIKSQDAERLARALAVETGESLTTAVTRALQERLARVRGRPNLARDLAIDEIFERAARTARRDLRSDDELLGYSGAGMFD